MTEAELEAWSGRGKHTGATGIRIAFELRSWRPSGASRTCPKTDFPLSQGAIVASLAGVRARRGQQGIDLVAIEEVDRTSGMGGPHTSPRLLWRWFGKEDARWRGELCGRGPSGFSGRWSEAKMRMPNPAAMWGAYPCLRVGSEGFPSAKPSCQIAPTVGTARF